MKPFLTRYQANQKAKPVRNYNILGGPKLSLFKKIKLAIILKSNMKNINFASWKTGLAGLIGLAATIVPQFWPEYSALMMQIVGIATSLGLLVARDNDVTSKEAGAGK